MKAVTQSTKDSRIDLRVNKAEKTLLELAAASQGVKLSEFVVSASTVAAEIALAHQNHFALSQDQMDKFMASLEMEPKNIDALRSLFSRKSVFE